MSLLHITTSRLFFITAALLLLTKNTSAQTTIINSANASGTSGADGSFEAGAHGWNTVNGAVNNWYIGGTAFCTGTRAAYIGTTPGDNNYNINTAAINHLYKDVTFPAGQSCITLSFSYRAQGESTWDGLRVYLGSTAVTPMAGTRFNTSDGTAVQLGNAWYNLTGTCTTVNITIAASNAGTTKRLVFSWENDNTVGTAPGATLDAVSLIAQTPTVPSCATGLTPANAATNVSICTNLSWTAPASSGCNTPTGYDLYFGTSPTPPFLATVTSTSHLPPMSPGITYYWQVRPSNGGGAAAGCAIQSFTTATSPISNFALVDDATSTAPYNCVTLTPNAASMRGCAWDVNSQFDFLSDFTYDMDINLGSNDAGADGMAFVIHNDPLGRCKCGTVGGALGAGGILNSVIVEIDTYINFEDRDDFTAPTIGTAGTEEPDHMDIWINGVVNPDLDGNGNAVAAGERVVPFAVRLQNPPGTNYNIENGANHKLRITWVAGTNTLTMTILNSALSITYGTISYSFNPITVFGTNTPYFGFTGSTGGLTNQQTFCLPAVLLPVEISSFEAVCAGENAMLYWKSEYENKIAYYEVEKSCNGKDFTPLAKVDARQKAFNYTVSDNDQCTGVTYYRLSETDGDGTKKILGYRSVNPCKKGEGILVYPNPAKDEVTIVLNSRSFTGISIRNSLGQAIYERNVISDEPLHFDVSQLASGVYYIIAWEEEKQHAVKFVVE